MDFTESAFPDFLEQFDMENNDNKDSLMDILNIPDMLYQGFDHLSNLPLENDDIEMSNITEKPMEDMDDPILKEFVNDMKFVFAETPVLKVELGDFDVNGTLALPEFDHCQSDETSEPPVDDAFATLKKLWPNSEEILKDAPKQAVSEVTLKVSKSIGGRKNMSLVSSKKLTIKKEPIHKKVLLTDDDSSDIDIETLDDESNQRSGAEILSMKLTKLSSSSDCVAARVREIIPKPRAQQLSSKSSDETNLKKNQSIAQEKVVAVKVEPNVNAVAKITELSPEAISLIKRRESLLRILPKGARIKPKSKDSHPASVVEKIRQSIQPPRTSILIPCQESPVNFKGKNLKNSNSKPTATEKMTTTLPVPLPPLSTPGKAPTSFAAPIVKLSSPTITSTRSPADPFRIFAGNESSSSEKPSPVTSSGVFEKSILKAIVSSTDFKSATAKSLQPSQVSSTVASSFANSNSKLIQPLVSVLTNTLKQELLNNGQKICGDLSQPLIMELKKLLPNFFPSSFDHNYCSNGMVKTEDMLDAAAPVIDPWLVIKKEKDSKSVIDFEGVGAIVTIKSEKNASNAPAKVVKKDIGSSKLTNVNLMKKDSSGKVSSPWHQDMLLSQLRSLKTQRRDSSSSSCSVSSSQRSKRHRSSCSPTSPRSLGKYHKSLQHNGNKRRCESRSYSRDSSSRSRSPPPARKSYSRSRSRSNSRTWSRTKKCWKRSRSPSISRSRSKSRDSFDRKYKKDRKRTRSPVWDSSNNRFSETEKERQIEEKRVIFVGNISNDTTKKDLYKRFSKFGEVIAVSAHYRTVKENFGFVTFAYRCDAYEALEHGNDEPKLPRFDLRYGCGKQYNKPRYCDFDSQAMFEAPKAKLDFDSLLQATRAQLMGKKHC